MPGRDRVVAVAAVQEDSPAYAHGLRAGNMIVGVNQRRVTTMQELGKALPASGRLALNVVRGEVLLTIQLR